MKQPVPIMLLILELGSLNWSEKKFKRTRESLISFDKEVWLVEDEGNRKIP